MGRGVSDVSAVSSASSQPARKLCTSGGKSATYRTEPEEKATAPLIAFSSSRLLPGQSHWIIRSRTLIGKGVRHTSLPLHAFHKVSNQDLDVRLTIPERRNPQKTQFRRFFRIPLPLGSK
jgi:hypothetical protein